MGKKEDLEKLDKLTRERMLQIVESGDLGELSDLNTVVQYLAKNNVVADKEKSSIEDNIEDRLAKAKARRAGVVEDDDEF